MRALLVVAGWLAALPVLAGEKEATAAEAAVQVAARSSMTDLGGQMVQLLLGLLLVIGLIFLLAWLARRLQQQLPAGSSNDTIQLLATRPLGPRERLLLVQVGKEQVLLGLTPGSIETLHVMQEPVEVQARESQAAGEFARRLKQALRQSGKDRKESR